MNQFLVVLALKFGWKSLEKRPEDAFRWKKKKKRKEKGDKKNETSKHPQTETNYSKLEIIS